MPGSLTLTTLYILHFFKGLQSVRHPNNPFSHHRKWNIYHNSTTFQGDLQKRILDSREKEIECVLECTQVCLHAFQVATILE